MPELRKIRVLVIDGPAAAQRHQVVLFLPAGAGNDDAQRLVSIELGRGRQVRRHGGVIPRRSEQTGPGRPELAM